METTILISPRFVLAAGLRLQASFCVLSPSAPPWGRAVGAVGPPLLAAFPADTVAVSDKSNIQGCSWGFVP